jgi:hypothetical protein
MNSGDQMVKGQVSTEYLVILAVVLVVALVVIGLLGWFPGVGGGTLETQSKSYWAGTSPFAITAYKISGTTVELSMRNMLTEKVTLTGISFGGTALQVDQTQFNGGEEKKVTATMPTPCGSPGTPFSYSNVTITYDQGTITGLKQVGDKPLIGKCS